MLNVTAVLASNDLDFDFEGMVAFCRRYTIKGSHSCCFSKQALIVWTMQNRWMWRARGHMNDL